MRTFMQFAGIWLCLSAVSGCQLFQRTRPVAIETRDAESKAPIPNVQVKISYPLETSPLAPSGSVASTAQDGIARTTAAPYGRAGVMVEVSAAGYLGEVKYMTVEEVQAIQPAGWFEDANKRPANLSLALFAEPAPSVDLIVPVTFRGQIKATVEVDEKSPAAAGQRAFGYDVPDTGDVVVLGPPVLKHLTPSKWTVRFAGNAPISARAKDSEIGYWLLKTEGKNYYFLVGTPQDYQNYVVAERINGKGRASQKGAGGGGKGGGRGRKGGGGASPTD